jgi:type II secretory pathway component GspD/PulD (secretin)
MNKPWYIKIIFCCIILSIGIWHSSAQSEPAQSKSEKSVPIYVGRNNPFEKIPKPEKNISQKFIQSAQLGQELPELFVDTVTLKFLDAKNLKEAIGNMSSEYGSIASDPKSNSLIICDTNDVLKKILSEIRKADKPPKQLIIEVVIVDVQLEDDIEIGINWDILSDKLYDVSYRQNLGSRLEMVPATSTNIADTTAFNTTSAAGIEGGYFALISGTVRNAVHLLQEKRNVEILASPKVMLVSGESASIETITELPYREVTQTSEGGELAATQFKEVGVKLNVTAILTDDDYILVTLEPEQSVDTGVFGTTSEIPIIDTRRAKTTLLLKDGQVVIMGGLRKKEITNQVSQIPVLGDLPLVGQLFRNNRDIVKNSELLVFISPHIYKNEPVSEKEMAKFKELRSRQMLSIPDEIEKEEQLEEID